MVTLQTSTPIYSAEQLQQLEQAAVPRHIAIIPDGNRRWARKSLLRALDGHRSGTKALVEIVKAAHQLKVKTLTLFTFSTENWNRSAEEVSFLMELLEANLSDYIDDLLANGVRLGVIGDLSPIAPPLVEKLQATIRRTERGEGIQLLLAINYGGRDDIRRAAIKASRDLLQGKLKEEELDEGRFGSYLDTAPWGDPDLLIRTSGEHRISNFLLWQLSYAEFYFANVFWPEFTPQHLLQAILEYQKRIKRLGA